MSSAGRPAPTDYHEAAWRQQLSTTPAASARCLQSIGSPRFWPLFEERRLQPRLERAFPARDAEAAFETLASNQVEGKLVLVLDESLV